MIRGYVDCVDAKMRRDKATKGTVMSKRLRLPARLASFLRLLKGHLSIKSKRVSVTD